MSYWYAVCNLRGILEVIDFTSFVLRGSRFQGWLEMNHDVSNDVVRGVGVQACKPV